MSKPQALKAATRRQGALNAAEAKALEAARLRDDAVLQAQAEGATYAEIQAATGLSTARITQVLRRQRQVRAI
jgi:uncharacterized protein YerC